MGTINKAMYFLAKYEALSNAAEMIRQHGEEGFEFNDEIFDRIYRREAHNLYKQLNDRAAVFAKKYAEQGIDIDTGCD